MTTAQRERMLQFLREEGCPENVISVLCQWIDNHPNATIGQVNSQLNVIVSDKFGHPNYKSFMDQGFRPIVRDQLLMGREVPALA